MKTFSLAAALTFLAALVLGTVLAAPALAHTALKSSDPKKNAEVESLEKVTLEFTESVRLPTVLVRSANGVAYQSGTAKADGAVVVQNVAGTLPAGAYTIAYRVVSTDGHPVQGEIPFTVVAAKATFTSGAGASPSVTASPVTTSAVAAPGSASPPGAHESHGETRVASEETQAAGIPPWVWIVVFGLAGVGIGMAVSLRPKKPKKP